MSAGGSRGAAGEEAGDVVILEGRNHNKNTHWLTGPSSPSLASCPRPPGVRFAGSVVRPVGRSVGRFAAAARPGSQKPRARRFVRFGFGAKPALVPRVCVCVRVCACARGPVAQREATRARSEVL